jgi:phospho-N-acetylmuramoyl-pentapeptide-transferase
MLYRIFYPLHEFFIGFNLFRYISFRTAMACISSFAIFMIFAPFFIRFMKRKGWIENVKRKGCEHLYPYQAKKEGTPTVGGILIIFATIISVILWCDIYNVYVWLTLSSLLWLGILGLYDDFCKIKKNSIGLSKGKKFFFQGLWGLILGFFLYFKKDYPNTLEFPFFKNLILNLGLSYILFIAIIVIASSNAVNLTDGLDGLAIGCIIFASFAYGALAYISGHIKLSSYLFITHIPNAGELTIFSSALAGASLGFLWYNAYPAQIFMGDTGSLSLGGAIATIAIIIKKELLLFLVGGVFVLEALSVILQVAYFRLKGKRFFLTAPFHHHFQLKGIPEPKIIVRIWIIAGILAILSLVTLKLR